MASLTELRERTRAWNRWANRTKLKIDWRFSTADARRVFHYQRIAIHESKHYPGTTRNPALACLM